MRRLAATLAILSSLTAPAWAAGGPPGAFADDALGSDAVRLAAAAKGLAAGQFRGRPADDLMAEGERAAADPERALKLLGGALAAGRNDRRVWLDLALAAQRDAAATSDAGRAARDRDWVLAATYRAYELSSNGPDRAAALAALSRLYAARESWRPALDAGRASLALDDDPRVRTSYDDLRAQHGFHLIDDAVDADAAAPRICLRFSEELKGSASDLAPYVAVDGQAGPALSVEDRQLCVEGLAHGARYHVAIRQGLPSTVGEDLLKSSDYDLFVPDRPPRIAFAGRGYVLPRVGAEGIPLQSVNVDRVDIAILHVDDRNLVGTLRSDDFRGQLAPWGVRELAADRARTVWSGTLDVASRLNADVTTAVPVRSALGRLGAGVYVLQAKVHGAAAGGDDDASGSDGRDATQWFVVSDLGLTALGGEGGLTVLARSLATAAPVAGATVRLLARDNEVLDTRATGPDGAVTFDPGFTRGEGGAAPAAVTAATGDGDADFLDLTAAPFDLTDRGDKGGPGRSGLDAFVYAERGVYRSGETVYLTALLRDGAGAALPGLPLTLVVSRPDGVESRRVSVPDGGLGGHSFALPLLPDAATGTWRVAAYADPKGPAIGEATFLVEDYLPERLAVELEPGAAALRPGEDAKVLVKARFLYGAAGAGLDVTGSSTVEAAEGPAWPSLKGYNTGLAGETVEPVRTDLPGTVATGRDGAALVTVPVPAVAATRPLEARIALSVGEPGGRALERGVTVPILPATPLIGVKAASARVDAGGTAAFDVVTVDRDGRRSAMPDVRWRLLRTVRDYQWYRDGESGRWRFERVESTKLAAEGRVSTAAAAPSRISAPVQAGSYRLDLSADGLPPTSTGVEAGYGGENTADSPDLLDVTLDRADYRPGDMLRATVASPFGGHATLVIGGTGVEARRDVELRAGDNEIAVPVEAAWGAGAYALVLAHRPLDAAAKRMPGRAVGLRWFSVDGASRRLGVELGTPPAARPRGPLHVPVKLDGLAPGEAAFVTVSAVDLGILNLTRYETPDPGPHFFGQRALGLELRDLYGALIDGLGVAAGALHQGGDAGFDHAAEKPSQAPLARYSGVVAVGPDGTAAVDFDIPAFNGTVRVAAVAWSRTRTGSAQADVVLRDPVVVTATLPRFLDIGDRARARFDLDDVEGPPGAYRLRVSPRGPWFLPAEALDQTVQLQTGARAGVDVPLTAAGLGAAGLTARLTGPGGLDLAQDVAIRVGAGAPAVYRRDVRPLAPGESLTLTRDLVAEFIPGSGGVSVAVSPLGDIDVPALLLALDRYPVGCSEQIVSRALPLLYLDRLAPPRDLALDDDVKPRIATAVAQLLSRETAEGSFGLWTADSGTDDGWLDAYVADFLTRARESGYAVPAQALDRALDRLRNTVANRVGDRAADDRGRDLSLGYAAYVLARNGRPVAADLRYLAVQRLDAVASPLGKAQLGAALAMLGDRARAAAVFGAAAKALGAEGDDRVFREDYGSKLRDAAAVLALAAEAGLDAAAAEAGRVLAQAQRSPYARNTQEQAWLVLAAQALENQARGLALDVDGMRRTGPFYREIPGARLDAGPVVLVNAGRTPVDVVVTTSGQLPAAEGAASQGYAVERRYVHTDGRDADPSRVVQNERLVVVVKVTEDAATRARLLLTDPLPAGFEIDNPALVEDGAVPDLPGLGDGRSTHAEFRDDRFTAAFERSPGDPAFFSVAYVVRAVTPGRFVHPPATVEDMYRPERFGRSGAGFVEVVPGG